MTGPRAAPAGTAAEEHAAAGSGTGHRAAPALTPSFAGRPRDLNLRSEARGKRGSGERGDARGREAEWAAFYRAEWPSVVRFLQVSYGEASAPDAADAAQNAFMDLFSQWDEVRSPRAWVRTVALRQIARQKARDQALLHKLSDAAHPELWCVPASGALEISDEEQAVLAALRRLPGTQRQVIALMYDGFSIREAAEMLGTTEAAVRQSLRRGRSKLRDMLYASDPIFRRVP
jgi:RNA polymerase sigma factor (sigma-70 family)